MAVPRTPTPKRYEVVTEEKATGATYTPPDLADFVAAEMIREWDGDHRAPLRILDPAIGEGSLLLSLLKRLPRDEPVEVWGFDNNQRAVEAAATKITQAYPNASLHLSCGDFLAFAGLGQSDLFERGAPELFDLIIANPPYVRTQVMGASSAQALAAQFGLSGRVDLYHAFVLAIARVLRPSGVTGIIVSNRFMTTKTGSTVRRMFQERLRLRHVWDLGDTKIFDAAVLPAVIIAEGLDGTPRTLPTFTSIYETKDEPHESMDSVTAALGGDGVVAVPDGRRFRVQRGLLDSSSQSGGVWRVATDENDSWLSTVERHTWARFGDLGRVRVGVKTCADRVFIRRDWHDLPAEERPEVLRHLTTHHIGRRFKADSAKAVRQILYPHEFVDGRRRAIDLAAYPNTRKYLEEHRRELEARSYVLEAGRKWFELWVPQDPGAWGRPKLVFRDISEEPCFWIDLDQTIVNGDCYWLVCDDPTKEDLLWLAVSVGNSTFIESFYDHCFNNKLYAGRRRFITQYVEKFPLPDPATAIAKSIIAKAKMAFAAAGTPEGLRVHGEIDRLVWASFGLPIEEV